MAHQIKSVEGVCFLGIGLISSSNWVGCMLEALNCIVPKFIMSSPEAFDIPLIVLKVVGLLLLNISRGFDFCVNVTDGG